MPIGNKKSNKTTQLITQNEIILFYNASPRLTFGLNSIEENAPTSVIGKIGNNLNIYITLSVHGCSIPTGESKSFNLTNGFNIYFRHSIN